MKKSLLKNVAVIFLIMISLRVQADWFSDEASSSGLRFSHINGMSGKFYFNENLGSGVALFDFDNDGDLDVYLVQGGFLDKNVISENQPTDRLFRNDLIVGHQYNRQLTFTDITEQAKIYAPFYGMGVAAGDYNNDGFIDIFVTNYGPNQLWKNNGDGTFSDVTAQAGVGSTNWSVSASFVDINRDGYLDLYTGNYVTFSTEKNKPCYAPTGERDYCAPGFFPAQKDELYLNTGDGRFNNISKQSGITKHFGPALGVSTADFNLDGWVDIYVANDAKPNQLWMNQKNNTFKDESLLAGVAVNMEGVAEASMGVDAADFDNDGDDDLFMTHLLGETNTIYVNDGQGWFEDRTLATGLAAVSKAFTAFGTAWFDFDNDGWLDLFTANGEVRVVPILKKAGDHYPLHQTNQLFRNLGNTKFSEVTADAGQVFKLSEVSRGAAFGDIDNDGDTDLVVTNNNGSVRLLMNHKGQGNNWLGFRFFNSKGHPVTGVHVAVKIDNNTQKIWRRSRTDGSYASANDPRVLLGLGKKKRIHQLLVRWPDGKKETWENLVSNQYIDIRQGQGKNQQAGQ